MPKTVLTARMLDSLKPAPAGKRKDYMDAIVPGLGVRVTDKADTKRRATQRTFVLVARYPGSVHPTRKSMGEVGELTLERARDKARDWLEKLQQGIDPSKEEQRQREAAARQRDIEKANTVAAVAEDFIRHVLIGPNPEKPKQRTGHTTAREIRKEYVERFGSRPIHTITSRDIRVVLDDAIARGATYHAHNLLGHARRLFNWAITREEYGIEQSPCDRMKPKALIGSKELRTRILNDAEMRAFWTACEKMAYPFGNLFQLLAVTGQRRSEISDARWSEIDLGEKLLTIPAERMKAKALHVVPLSTDAMAILKALPRFKKGDFLFSTTFGEVPVSGFSKAKLRLDALMLELMKADAEEHGNDPAAVKIEPFVLHDIRRTMRTGLSALPIPDLVRELAIAHTKPGLHKVYDQHAYLDEKRQALELWAARLRNIVTPPPANVVKLPARR